LRGEQRGGSVGTQLAIIIGGQVTGDDGWVGESAGRGERVSENKWAVRLSGWPGGLKPAVRESADRSWNWYETDTARGPMIGQEETRRGGNSTIISPVVVVRLPARRNAWNGAGQACTLLRR
jgi:hypothetical protein